MYAIVSQTNFARGAVDAAVSGRIELGLFKQSGRKCSQFIPSLRGPAVFRSGTWVKDSLAGEAVQMPFAFNVDQQYVLLFTETHIVFYVYDADGELIPLLDSLNAHVTLASPYTLQQAKEVKFAQTLDVMYLTHPSVAPQRLRRTAADAFTIGTYTRASDPFDDPSSGTVGWPAAVCFHEGRLVYAGSTLRPLTFWASRSTDFESHAVSAPIVATDAFTATVSVSSTPFKWVVSAENQVLFGTGDNVLAMTGGEDGITALQFKVEATATTGVSEVLPLRRDGFTFYATQGSKNVRHFRYDLLSESYKAPETSLLSRGLLSEGIKASAICDREDPLYLWLDNKGIIRGHIFEEEENDLSGWFEWQIDGEVLSICAHVGGRLSFVTLRNGNYYLETLAQDADLPDRNTFLSGDTDTDTRAYYHASKQASAATTYLDGSVVGYDGLRTTTVTYDPNAQTITDAGSSFVVGDVGRELSFKGVGGYNVGVFLITGYVSADTVEVQTLLEPEATTETSWYIHSNQISGVTEYANQQVSVVVGGVYFGEVTLDANGDYELPAQGSYIVVGKKYIGYWQSNLIGIGGEAGRNSWRTPKTITQFDVLALGYGGSIGTSPYRLAPIQVWDEELLNYAAVPPMDGYVEVAYTDQALTNSTVWVSQDVPMPLHIVAWQAGGTHAL